MEEIRRLGDPRVPRLGSFLRRDNLGLGHPCKIDILYTEASQISHLFMLNDYKTQA